MSGTESVQFESQALVPYVQVKKPLTEAESRLLRYRKERKRRDRKKAEELLLKELKELEHEYLEREKRELE